MYHTPQFHLSLFGLIDYNKKKKTFLLYSLMCLVRKKRIFFKISFSLSINSLLYYFCEKMVSEEEFHLMENNFPFSHFLFIFSHFLLIQTSTLFFIFSFTFSQFKGTLSLIDYEKRKRKKKKLFFYYFLSCIWVERKKKF